MLFGLYYFVLLRIRVVMSICGYKMQSISFSLYEYIGLLWVCILFSLCALFFLINKVSFFLSKKKKKKKREQKSAEHLFFVLYWCIIHKIKLGFSIGHWVFVVYLSLSLQISVEVYLLFVWNIVSLGHVLFVCCVFSSTCNMFPILPPSYEHPCVFLVSYLDCTIMLHNLH